MTILLIHNFYTYYGGADTYYLSLSRLLKRKGHKVITFSKDSNKITDNILSKLRVAAAMFHNVGVERELTRVIKKYKPDIAQFQNIYPLITPMAYTVCKRYKIPIIQRISNYRFICPKSSLFREGKTCQLCIGKIFPYPSIIYSCYHQSRMASIIFSLSFLFHNLIKSFNLIDMFLFPSDFIRDYYLKNLNIPRKKTVVIPTFTDIDGSLMRKTIDQEEEKYFLFVGRLSEEKGIIPLLRVFRTLPKINLVVVGDGPLKEKVLEYKKYKNIIIKGFQKRDKVVNYIRNALAIVIPSLWYDVLPNVLLESFACGRPVLVPANGNFNTFVKDNLTGLFYKNGDYVDLKKKIVLLARRKLIFEEKKIKEEFNKKYTPQVHYSRLMEVYNSLLKKHGELN